MPVEFYDFGRIKIDGEFYERDVVIFPDHIFSPWVKRTSHFVDAEELNSIPDLLKSKPEIIIIGTGYDGVTKVDKSAEEFLKSKNIELIIQKTTEAVKTFNEAIKNKKIAVALLHLTC